ncbi:TVP38/TMEM64 family protein [Aneurinibacillus aneurinilyticus]|uniref:TVP38/TMEM64 family protein n=1 Tax=Aneurinibacillus aneurinilyticus TaxID=1391 RepID=UPI003525575F
MNKKVISILLFVLIVVLGYTQKDIWVAWMKEGGMLAITISISLVAIDVFFPVIPFPILAGMIGSFFGVWQGTSITLTGAMLGTMILFFLVRYGFRDWAEGYVNKHPKVNEYKQSFEKNSFVAIFLSRAIPVVPSLAVNAICGLSNVRWSTFFLASLLGKIPNNLLVNFAGANFEKSKWFSFGIYGAYMLIIFIITYIMTYRKLSRAQVQGADE